MPIVKKNVNLNLQQLLRWRENPEINPKTGKAILINGPTYNEIQKRYDKYMEPYTREECDKWFSSKEVNPKTARKIKPGKVVYERIRMACEPQVQPPSENVVENLRRDYEENIRENIEHNIQEMPFIKKVYSKCTSCATRLSQNVITSLGCTQSKCMIKGCPWEGRYGINLSRVPDFIKLKIISVVKNFIYPDRCCCTCLGHLIMILGFLSFTNAEKMIEPLSKESNRLERAINKIETSVENFNDTTTLFIASESNKLIGIWKERSIWKIIGFIFSSKFTNKDLFMKGVSELFREIIGERTTDFINEIYKNITG